MRICGPNDLDFDKDFHIKLVAISRPTPRRNFLGITDNVLQAMATITRSTVLSGSTDSAASSVESMMYAVDLAETF